MKQFIYCERQDGTFIGWLFKFDEKSFSLSPKPEEALGFEDWDKAKETANTLAKAGMIAVITGPIEGQPPPYGLYYGNKE